MSVVWDDIEVVGQKTLKFLYKLKQGMSDRSYGIECGKLMGVTKDVIKRSHEVAECILKRREVKPLDNVIDDKLSCQYKSLLKDLVEWKGQDADAFVTAFIKANQHLQPSGPETDP